MVGKVEQINPLDIRSSVGVGVNLPFTGKAVFNSTYTSKDAIKANLINFFLTNKGERYLNPTFGSDIRTLLFENIDQDSIENTKTTIVAELSNYFPRLRVNKFEINTRPDYNTLEVVMRYSIINSNIEDELLINIEQ